MTSFTDKQNIQMLWDILLDEIGVDKNNFRFSDDGEPSNTAGKPIINQIDSKKISRYAN